MTQREILTSYRATLQKPEKDEDRREGEGGRQGDAVYLVTQSRRKNNFPKE